MKRAAAIILSLTLIWLHVVASAQTTSAAGEPVKSCCGCHKACCVSPSASAAIPLPATPVAASASVDFVAVIPKLLAWTLPATAPAIVSSSDRSASSPAVPLYTRHCALLI